MPDTNWKDLLPACVPTIAVCTSAGWILSHSILWVRGPNRPNAICLFALVVQVQSQFGAGVVHIW